MPTVGFSSEVVKTAGATITFFDLGGGARIRGIWPKYFAAVCATTPVVLWLAALSFILHEITKLLFWKKQNPYVCCCNWHIAQIHGAIFVIDAANEKRLDEVKTVLFECVSHPLFAGKNLLMYVRWSMIELVAINSAIHVTVLQISKIWKQPYHLLK